MKKFHEWLIENSMKSNAAGYLVEGKVFCPECYEREYSWRRVPDVAALTPSKVEKALKGSRPEADRLTRKYAGGPSYACNGCTRRYIDKGWKDRDQNTNQPSLWETEVGERCENCLPSTDKEYLIHGAYARNAGYGDICSGCELTSTGWEWVDVGAVSEGDRIERLHRLGFK
jgi:hypothetical protein